MAEPTEGLTSPDAQTQAVTAVRDVAVNEGKINF